MSLPPRIRALMDAALRYRVTEVIAPAGFGKSTLIDELATSGNVSIARIRPGEEAPSALMQALCAGVAAQAPDLQRALLVAYGNAAATNTTAQLARWFVEGLPSRDHAIAVDDLHNLRDDGRAWRLLQEIIESSGDKAHWILASRTWLHLPTVNWVASGLQGGTIHEADLALRPTDVSVIAAALKIGVSDEVATKLVEATHGWPLLVMYSLRLISSHRDALSVLETVRGRGVDAVTEQILSELSAEDRRLLVAVSLYDGALPEVLERTNSGAGPELVRLASSGVPLIQGNDRRWRLHDILRARLLDRDADLRISEAHRLCHDLETVQLELALRIAIMSGSSDLVRTVLERDISYFLSAGNIELVRQALAHFCSGTVDKSAKITVLRGALEMKFGQPATAVAFLRRAVDLSTDDERPVVLTRLGLALVNLQGHAAEGFDVLRAAAGLALPQKIDDACEVLGGTGVGFVLCGDKEKALSQIARAIELLPQASTPLTESRVYLRAGQVAGAAGLLERAKGYLERSIAISERFGFFDALSYGCHLAKNVNGYDREALAIEYAEKAVVYAAKTMDHEMLYMERVALFVYACRAGNIARARALKRLLWPMPDQRRPRLHAVVSMTVAHLSMLEGDLAVAEVLLSEIKSFGEPAMNPEIILARRIMYYSYSATVCSLRSMHEEALRKARQCLGLLAEMRVEGLTLAALTEIELTKICCAAILAFNGRISEAQPILDDMAANAHEQYRRDLASWVSELIGDPCAEPSAEARTRANGIIILLQRCADGIEATTLTPAERRVLDALAEGYAAKEIAAMTGRSSKTVNNQITSILRKLQARSRGEAVARARRRGLLSTEAREPASV